MEQIARVDKGLILWICLSSLALPSWGQQEKSIDFKLAKEKFNLTNYYATVNDSTSKVDTTKIYYRFEKRPTVFAKNGKYQVLKFHNNGMVQLTTDTVLSETSATNISALDPKDFGYYRIENSNEIKIELYRDAITDMGWWSGKVYKNAIVFDKVNNTKQRLIFTAQE
jgi:hypothetical protein